MARYIIRKGTGYIGSPTSTVTDNPHLAACYRCAEEAARVCAALEGDTVVDADAAISEWTPVRRRAGFSFIRVTN